MEKILGGMQATVARTSDPALDEGPGRTASLSDRKQCGHDVEEK